MDRGSLNAGSVKRYERGTGAESVKETMPKCFIRAIIFDTGALPAPDITWRCDMGEFGDKVEGEVKEQSGKLTGDKKTEWEGKAQGLKGDIEGAGRKADEKKVEETEPTV